MAEPVGLDQWGRIAGRQAGLRPRETYSHQGKLCEELVPTERLELSLTTP